jgi:hypothetical protein
MCFGSKSKTPATPQPEPAARFDYNVTDPNKQQKSVAIASSLQEPNQQAAQTLGGSAPMDATSFYAQQDAARQ